MKNPRATTSRSSRNLTPLRIAESKDSVAIPLVKIPVRCPQCDLEQLCEYPEPVVVMALTRWNNMNLYVPCHEGHWSASRQELHAIRQYLGEAWIKARAETVLTQRPRLRIFV
jgi:hypothetical protein